MISLVRRRKDMRFLLIFLALVGLLTIIGCEKEGGIETSTASPQATTVEMPSPQLPTATPTPGLPAFSAAECEYVEATMQQAGQIGDAMEGLLLLFEEPEFFSETWRIDLAIHLANLKLVHDEARALEPPASLAAIHNHWLIATSLYADMADRIIGGIDELDVAEIEAAIELGLQGNEAVDITTSLLDDFIASRSGTCP